MYIQVYDKNNVKQNLVLGIGSWIQLINFAAGTYGGVSFTKLNTQGGYRIRGTGNLPIGGYRDAITFMRTAMHIDISGDTVNLRTEFPVPNTFSAATGAGYPRYRLFDEESGANLLKRIRMDYSSSNGQSSDGLVNVYFQGIVAFRDNVRPDIFNYGFISVGVTTGGTVQLFIFATKSMTSTSYVVVHNYAPDPLEDGGFSEEDYGGKGNFSEHSDIVVKDALPDETTHSAVGSGFSTIFTPTKAQLKHLADVMWGATVVGFFQNMIENISDMFVSLALAPFQVPQGATVNVKWLGLVDTEIALTLASNQFVEFDMGSIDMSNNQNIFKFDTVLDYAPYSRLGIYLPFIGYQELDIDECRNAIIGLTYRIDVLSGSTLAIISIDGREIYQFSGSCLCQIPLTGQDANAIFSNAVSIGVAAASAEMAGAVASAGDAATAASYSAGEIGADAAEYQAAKHAAQVSNAQNSLASATANGMMGMKPTYKKSGAVGASTSLFTIMQPYLFLMTPRQSYPENYAHFCGFPSNITDILGNFEGFTVVEDIRLNGLVATSPEVEEIYRLLKTGVII